MFKEGDFVRHKPSGCVGKYISGEKLLFVEWPCAFEGPVQVVWSPDDCEPVTDKQPVNADLYEAAERLIESVPNPLDSPNSRDYSTEAMFDLEKALANSKPVEPQGWITSRRPTEEDADEYGRVFVWQGDFTITESWDSGFSQFDGHEWQPVPLCLRIPPKEQPKCETCEHYYSRESYNNGVGDIEYDVKLCCLTKREHPTYDMDGCVYKRKE